MGFDVRGDLISAVPQHDHDTLQACIRETANRMGEEGASGYSAKRFERGGGSKAAALPGGKQDRRRNHLTLRR